MTREEAKELAKDTLSRERYRHTLCVEKAAKRIAEEYGIDPEKAKIAALLHDICKEMPDEDLLQTLKGSDIIEAEQAEMYLPVLHAFAGAVVVRRDLGLDEDTANAVCYHTTGRAGMSLLERTVFLADCISEDRDYKNLDELRSLAKKSPDEACLLALRNSIIHVTKQLKPLNPLSCAAFNRFVSLRGKENG